MKKIVLFTSLLLSFLGYSVQSQTTLLKQKIDQLLVSKNAIVGVAIYDFETGDSLCVNGQNHFPMQSVYKLHLALAVLNEIETGKLSLDQKIFVKKNDLNEMWSPLRQKYPNGNIELTLKEILNYTVCESDNTGCDILFRLLGGTNAVDQYIHNIGIKDVSIKATEEEMSRNWNVQYTNWKTPIAAAKLLKKIEEKKILSKESQELLWKMLCETTTGKMRLKAGLPEGTVVAHRIGTSGRNENGLSAATNDIGIIVKPDGKQIAISVFVTNSMEDTQTNEKMIADIARLIWDYYTTKC